MNKVKAPPYRVGTKVRYAGDSPFAYSGKWVRPGDEGIVVKVTEAEQPTGIVLEDGPDEGMDGWSTVEFPSGCRVAVMKGDEKRFPKWTSLT